jgi:nucleotidyltransferase/DNA polymerase involved in DNA repair
VDTYKKINRKSLSVERTFRTIHTKSELFEKLYDICDSVSNNLIEENLECKHVTLKFKSSAFEVISKSLTTKNFIESTEDVYSHASVSLVYSYSYSRSNSYSYSNSRSYSYYHLLPLSYIFIIHYVIISIMLLFTLYSYFPNSMQSVARVILL